MSDISTTASLRVPVLLIIFNRPDTTRLVFDAIRQARPPRLYIAADGPRPGVESDVDNCRAARGVVSLVDWDCEVHTLFHERNLNCGVAPSTAFTWFFHHEEAGIILEDDCVPSQSFFGYCQELLERYKNDTRVMHIGGNNFLNGWENDNDYSYYFSKRGHVWGWATWRRAWKHFDYNISLYRHMKQHGFFTEFYLNPIEKLYRTRKFEKTIENQAAVNWWDYQWDFARHMNSGLSIVPRTNLVRNVGFGDSATHTRNSSTSTSRLKANEIELPLRHPPFMIADVESERRYFNMFFREGLRTKIMAMRSMFPG